MTSRSSFLAAGAGGGPGDSAAPVSAAPGKSQVVVTNISSSGRGGIEVDAKPFAFGCQHGASPWGGLLNRVGTWLNWFGSDTGGMRVRVAGIDAAGRRKCLTWELVAESNHGPEIPCMAAILLAIKLHRGHPCALGAQACMGMLELAEFEPEFARWDIKTQVSESMS